MDIITNLIHEASHYTSFDQIENLIDEGESLANLPVQPLYALTTNMNHDALALCLPSFSKEPLKPGEIYKIIRPQARIKRKKTFHGEPDGGGEL